MATTQLDTWSAITEPDEIIKAALEEANIPALMVSLVHVTGDMNIIRGGIRPHARTLGDPYVGITEAQRATVRVQALEILTTFRDGGCKLPQAPTVDQVREMMDFLVGEPLPDDYGQFLMGELSLDGGDPYAQPGMGDIPLEKKRAFHVIIIGTGMSGILAAYPLKEAGISFTAIEKNASVGGTWFENTYPGCRVDTPNHVYSYSFKPRDWPKYYSPQNVLLKYFNECADEFGIRPHIRFNTSVELAEFDEKTYTWRVRVKSADGASQTLEAQAVISAVGQLNRPKLPEIEGRETFNGISFHSARWGHGHDLTDKRIAVIGTGASAFQFIPEIARQAGEVFVFQRTPNWIAIEPVYHDDIPEGKHWLLKHVPFYAKWFRVFRFWHIAEGVLDWVKKDASWTDQTYSISPANDELRAHFTKGIKSIVGDDADLLQSGLSEYVKAEMERLGKQKVKAGVHQARIANSPVSAIIEHFKETGEILKGAEVVQNTHLRVS